MKKKKKLLVAGIALSVLFSTNLQAQTVNYTPFETKESQKIVNELYNRMRESCSIAWDSSRIIGR